MANEAKFYLVTPADQPGPASNGLFIPACLYYRIGEDMRLYRAKLPFPPRRGLMAIDAVDCNGDKPAQDTAREIMLQCMGTGHQGLMLDLPRGQPGPGLEALIRQLAQAAKQHGLPLYLCNGHKKEGCCPIMTAAPMDGNVRALLKKIADENRGGRFAVTLSVRGSDFSLPGRGMGQQIGAVAAIERAAQRRAARHYSPELEAMYALYPAAGREHLLIWDTAQTVARRAHAAFEAGCEAVFIVWPQVSPFWDELEPLLWSIKRGLYPSKTKQDANHR